MKDEDGRENKSQTTMSMWVTWRVWTPSQRMGSHCRVKGAVMRSDFTGVFSDCRLKTRCSLKIQRCSTLRCKQVSSKQG